MGACCEEHAGEIYPPRCVECARAEQQADTVSAQPVEQWARSVEPEDPWRVEEERMSGVQRGAERFKSRGKRNQSAYGQVGSREVEASPDRPQGRDRFFAEHSSAARRRDEREAGR